MCCGKAAHFLSCYTSRPGLQRCLKHYHCHRPDLRRSQSMNRSTKQSLWDHITARPEDVPVPDWHREILAERLATHNGNKDQGKD
jgi:hypothetical protein